MPYDEDIINDESLTYLDKIKLLMKNNKIIQKIIKKFKDNPELNSIIVFIQLIWIDDNINIESIGHANSVIIYKFMNNDQVSYLCLRNEPHRHANIYCRNSVRKAIRDIFSQLPNSYYLDYIINSRTGLQINENNDIDKENLTDFDNLPKDMQKLSPLQGNSGFCASWTVYTMLVLLLNRSVPLEKMGEYFATFDTISKSEKFIQEFNKCFNPDTTKKNNESCRNKDDFIKEVTDYIKNTESTITKKIKHQYILTKHIKLYRTIIYIVYFITRKLNNTRLFNNTNLFNNIPDNDKKILNEIFDKFEKKNDPVKERLINQSTVKINISNDILNKDIHLCDDNLFDHKDFCLDHKVSKILPENKNKWNCNDNKFKVDDKIVLKTVSESNTEQLNVEKFDELEHIIKIVNI
jgi:hypothetical protein